MNEYQVFKAGPKKGQPKTLTDRVVRYLVEGLKVTEVKSKSSKYRQFIVKSWIGQFYFVGQAGGVRLGHSISNSSSWTTPIHNSIRDWEARLQAQVDKRNQMLAETEKNINCLDKVIHEG
jgi:hypothetical protein